MPRKSTKIEVNWNNQLDDNSDYEGFVYEITHKETGKSYIGKKSYWSRTTKKVEGRKNRKHILKESNWRVYISSNKTLQEWIKRDGIEGFDFNIIMHCKSKRELTFYEVYYQFKKDVLFERLDNGEFKFLNDNIAGKHFRTHLVD